MSKTGVIWTVIILAVVILGVWFLSSSSMGSDQMTATSTPSGATTSASSASAPGKQTFKSLLADKGDFECKYEQVSGSGRSTNVVYIADGKLRGEYRTTGATTNTSNLMVYDGQYLYTWAEGAKTGNRTLITKLSDLPKTIPIDLTSGAVLGTSNTNNVSWDCHPWIKDTALLQVPTYVTFN